MALSPSQQAELNRLKKEANDLEEKAGEAGRANLETTETYKNLLQDIQKLREQEKETAEESWQRRTDEIILLQKIANLTGDIADQQSLIDKQLEVSVDKLAEENIELQKQIDALDVMADGYKDQAVALQKRIQDNAEEAKQLQAGLDLRKKNREAAEGIAQGVSDTVGGLLGSIDASQTFLGKMMAAAGPGGAGGIGAALKEVGKGLKAALNPANIMAGLFAKIGQSTLMVLTGMDDFRADLTKAGASLDKYGDTMNEIRDANVAAGVGMKEATESMLALHKGMSSFNTMSAANRKALAGQTAVMSKLGVSAETSAQNYETMSKSMGMSASEMVQANKQIAATADALGMSIAGAAEDFAKASNVIAAHGKQGVQVFRDLQTQAKATGMSMEDLLGVAGKFDTFEDAAEQTAMLNATMGTSLNAMEMLNASEADRIKMLKQSLAATGKSWASMDKWERKQAAAVLTGGDLNKAAKLMTANLNATASAAQKAALADQELADKAANATTAKEKMMLVAERFAVAVIPLVNIMHGFLDIILGLNQALGGAFIPVMITALGLWLVMSKVSKASVAAKQLELQMLVLEDTARKAGIITKEGELVATQSTTVATNQGIIAKIKDRIATVARTIATGIATAAGWVWIAMKGVYNAIVNHSILLTLRETAAKIAGWVWDKIIILWEGIKAAARWFGFTATVASTGAEAASIPVKIASTAATTAAVGPTLAFGAAMLMVGAGVFLAAYGISLVVVAFAQLNPAQIVGAVVAIWLFTSAMIALGTMMVTLGPAAIGPMLAFGFAFLMIGAGVMMAGIGMLAFAAALGIVLVLLLIFAPVMIILVPVMFLLSAALVVLGMGVIFLASTMPAMIVAAFGIQVLSGAMFGLGIAMLMMGVGLALAAIGIAVIVISLERLVAFSGSFAETAKGLMMLVGAFVMLGLLSFFLFPIIFVLEVLTLGILALAAALAFIKTDDLKAIAEIASGIGNMKIESAIAFGKAMVETKETVKTMGGLPVAAAILMGTTAAFAMAPAGAREGGEKKRSLSMGFGAGGADGAPGGPGGPGGRSDTGERTIILKLNEREFGRAVVNIFEKNQDINKMG